MLGSYGVKLDKGVPYPMRKVGKVLISLSEAVSL